MGLPMTGKHTRGAQYFRNGLKKGLPIWILDPELYRLVGKATALCMGHQICETLPKTNPRTHSAEKVHG